MIQVDDSLVLRYLVPFTFDNGYAQICQTLDQEACWDMTTQTVQDASVFRHLFRSIYSETKENGIGSTWKYNFKNRFPEIRYMPEGNVVGPLWQIREAQMHIFHTNIGLFWYELVLKKNEKAPLLDDLILMQNRFKECSHTDHFFAKKRPTTKDFHDTVFDPFDVAVWLDGILGPVGDLNYLNGSCIKNGRNCPSRALIFNYVLMKDETDISLQQLQRNAYQLANGYNAKYLPSADALQAGLHPFEDVCIYASRSGCGYYAAENGGNKAFFGGNFNESIRQEYFFLFVLVLYQSYSLLYFHRKSTAEFPSDPACYNGDGELGERLDQLMSELNTFLMKGIHTSVSSVHHHNEFYNYLMERFMIRADIESIEIGTEALVELQHMRRDRVEAQERETAAADQERRNRRLDMALMVLSLFSLFSVFSSMDELFDWLRAINVQQLWEQVCLGSAFVIAELIAYIAVFIIAVVCIVVLIINSLPCRGKKKRKS